MPYQNRVTPFGELVVTPERGRFMGNRGVLHNDEQRIVRFSQVRRWIVCLTDFKGRKRQLMSPGRYTELFFMDEAVALAAGHRPCFKCRRPDAIRFRAAFARAVGVEGPFEVDAMDDALDEDRLEARGAMRRWQADVASLPTGVMIQRDDCPFLVVEGGIRRWSFGGYGSLETSTGSVTVLTPRLIAATIAEGYRPDLHPSAGVG